MRSATEARLRRLERRGPQNRPGLHRLTDAELAALVACLRSDADPLPAWALAIITREELCR